MNKEIGMLNRLLIISVSVVFVLGLPPFCFAGPVLYWTDASEGDRDESQSHAFYQAAGSTDWRWIASRTENPGKGQRTWDLGPVFEKLGFLPVPNSCFTLMVTNIMGAITVQAWIYDEVTKSTTNRVCLGPPPQGSWPASPQSLRVESGAPVAEKRVTLPSAPEAKPKGTK